MVRILVMTHGAGSSAEFLSRAFPPDCVGCDGSDFVDDRTGDVTAIARELLDRVRLHLAAGRRVVLGGVSIGSHAAAFATAELLAADGAHGLEALVLALPSWTGPDCNPAVSFAADLVRRRGAPEVLADLQDGIPGGDWVTAELHLAWRARPTLAQELARSITCPAPSLAQLASITTPSVVLGLADDPLHPLDIARTWSQALPRGRLGVVARDAPGPGTDPAARRVLGDAAGDALRLSGWLSGGKPPATGSR